MKIDAGLMAGLDQASTGDVILFGQNLAQKNEEQRSSIRAGKVGFVFQSFHLVQGASAVQNVMLPLELGGVDDAQQLALNSLQRVGRATAAVCGFCSALSWGRVKRYPPGAIKCHFRPGVGFRLRNRVRPGERVI